jgi:hypothetical protein
MYETGYQVEEIMGSQLNKERKRVLYLIKWKRYLVKGSGLGVLRVIKMKAGWLKGMGAACSYESED